ncbi:MAG: triosephosphate isomerase [Pseudomonadota bacterium]|jgi:triosephosphate isomerase
MKKLLIANWKTYLSSKEALDIAKEFNDSTEIIIAPAMMHLGLIKANFPKIALAAQDVSSVADSFGAFTGETPAELLKSSGIGYSLIGHSERRSSELDSNSSVKNKVAMCAKAGIIPIVCVGETFEERRSKKYKSVISEQLHALNDLAIDRLIVAYEPVWAVGTGVLPSNEEILEVMRIIGSSLNIAKEIVLVYGGSVNANNISEIASIPFIDGVLVGKASTDLEHLKKLLKLI